ncbi:MAG: tRNA (guanosine(37)-N1)-methyltransferase TrmD [Planctomycetota bacterium]|jgi:tRNA (guanine37-N1)-methyltransferase
MRIDLLSIFPGMFDGVIHESILAIAQKKGLVSFHTHNIRDWSDDPKHFKVDDRPFGGGPGMVMKAEPIVSAVEAVRAQAKEPGRLLFMSPQGRPFSQEMAYELAESQRVVMVCGRYEGFDERIFDVLQPEEVSVGDYVLTGGELAAMVIADAVVRLIPGVVGCADSVIEESFGDGLLDCPHYTQPATWRGMSVPEVLRGGNHRKIEEWRHEQAMRRTRLRRPDLLGQGGAHQDVAG